MDDAGAVWAVFIVILILVFLGGAMGKGCSDEQWRKDLVDSPDYISAIRSNVITERAARAALKNKR
jgi:hypothetical protein